MDCDQILPKLYVGSCPTSPEEVAALQKHDVSAVLNLQSNDDFESHDIDWATLQARYSSLGIETRRVPITDFDDGDLWDKLPVAVCVLTELLKREHTVFIHCNAGVNRSPSTVICYLHWAESWHLDEAVRHVQRCHPCSPVMEVIRMATGDRKRGSVGRGCFPNSRQTSVRE